LPMWVADMDFRAPEAVIAALQKKLDHGIFGYPSLPDGLTDTVLAWLSRRHGWEVEPEALVFLPGVVTGFNLAAQALTRPGEGVLVQTPTYGPFFRVAANANLIQQEMELIRGDDGQYQVDLDAFEAAITPETRIFMLCNPQNPTGRVFRKDELEAMAEICLRNEVIICSDEIHSDLIYSGNKHIPIANLSPEIANQTVTFIAPSKTFNIAGLKASAAIIPNPEMREKFKAARRGVVDWVNLLGLTAMQAAYASGEPWLDALLLYLESNRDYLVDFVARELPSVRVTAPQGTFLAWLDCRELEIEQKPSTFFRQEAKVALNDGAWFGQGGEGFVRLNFGCPRATLEAGLGRLKTAVEKIC
ncbi:MAG TPA: putative C-S lyase, partial [Anaerolineales bacterium]|nr:putative C-S lyase [Anaerolineales bacterium]